MVKSFSRKLQTYLYPGYKFSLHVLFPMQLSRIGSFLRPVGDSFHRVLSSQGNRQKVRPGLAGRVGLLQLSEPPALAGGPCSLNHLLNDPPLTILCETSAPAPKARNRRNIKVRVNRTDLAASARDSYIYQPSTPAPGSTVYKAKNSEPQTTTPVLQKKPFIEER
jgi:hypothetical protein